MTLEEKIKFLETELSKVDNQIHSMFLDLKYTNLNSKQFQDAVKNWNELITNAFILKSAWGSFVKPT